MIIKLIPAALCLGLLLAAGGCPRNTRPRLEITYPAALELPAGGITIEVKVANFHLVNRLLEPNVVGEGHLHYFFDFPVPTEPGKPAVAPEGKYAATAEPTYTWREVPPGEHTFAVELVNNDNTPLVPPVVAEITLRVT